MIPFNKPYIGNFEIKFITDVLDNKKLSGNGFFSQKCQSFFEDNYQIGKALLTTSCTDALEMSALLMEIKEGDEVILPSFTFVSTANAFVLRGAKLVFADSSSLNPNIDVFKLEGLITSKTKAIIVVHYAGISVDMDPIIIIAKKYNLYVVEDAAQAVDSFYKGIALGTIGDFSTFSFHETKNIISGEGGLLGINNEKYYNIAEIIWEKGTNRSAYLRGEIDKYSWVSIGSSFLPSELIASFLFGQLNVLCEIQNKRKKIWSKYDKTFKSNGLHLKIGLPNIPNYASNNAHMYYLICKNIQQRSEFISHMKKNGINVVSHYLSLHSSPFFLNRHDGRKLEYSDMYTDCLVRLPLYYELNNFEQEKIIENVINFFSNES